MYIKWVFFYFSYLHSRMWRIAVTYSLFLRHSRMAWTAASEELKVGSGQEFSRVAISSFVTEAAATLRLLFNSFSSLDMLVSLTLRGIKCGLYGWCHSSNNRWPADEWCTYLGNGAYCMDLFNQLTIGLKKQQQLKVEFVESLTKLQSLKAREEWLLTKCLFTWQRFLFLRYDLILTLSTAFGGY